MFTRAFIHGLEGSSQGDKGSFFRERYSEMIVEDYVGDFEARMTKLNAVLADKDDLILVGSSFGGLMAAFFACHNMARTSKLILLAPALNYLPPEVCGAKGPDCPVIIYHGRQDNVVPPGPVHDIAKRLFRNLAYNPVEDEHSLHQTFFRLDWDALLYEC